MKYYVDILPNFWNMKSFDVQCFLESSVTQNDCWVLRVEQLFIGNDSFQSQKNLIKKKRPINLNRK